ncbi:MAG TPA: hypothetical protein VL687_04430 [Methylomirabilota bacterium]|jgi:hypothetical protein|nr:hypothetical protein [Methylomirabilota bacterium]
MNPAIKRYLDEHGATYTPEALRKGLLDAGYDPAEVDAAVASWNAAAASGPEAARRRTFGAWALRLHILALLVVFVALVALKGTGAIGTALLGCAVLGVFLVIGWAISSLIGRALLGTGVTVALLAPAISAIIIGGSCFALLSSAIGTPPRQGTVTLELDAPRAFAGSGGANCYIGGGIVGVNVSSQQLGTTDGKQVSVQVYWYGPTDRSVSVLLDVTSQSEQPESYSTIPGTKLDATVGGDAFTGTIRFEGLAAEPGSGGQGAPDAPASISGTVTWDCE